MIELLDRADKYASGKSNAIIDKAIAQAYADGYRDGYKDRDDEIPVDLRDNKTEFVDLGLPSGTLWAPDYEKENGNIIFLPQDDTKSLSLPTRQQWEELINSCQWKHIPDATGKNLTHSICIGPNGKYLKFTITGKYEAESKTEKSTILFWLKDEENNKNCARINWYLAAVRNNNGKNVDIYNGSINSSKEFKGYKLPIRIVKQK